MPEPVTIEAHQRRLGAGEERGQHEQHDDQEDQQAYRSLVTQGSMGPPMG